MRYQALRDRRAVRRGYVGALRDARATAASAGRHHRQLKRPSRAGACRRWTAAEEAQGRFREDLARRDTLREQEIERLQAALQDLARREKALQLELSQLRAAGGNDAVAAEEKGG